MIDSATVLLVNSDQVFCDTMQTCADMLKISLDTVTTLSRAKDKLSADSNYKACIIASKYKDGSGIDLVYWWRDYSPNKLMSFALISNTNNSAKEYRLFKQSLTLDYVLAQPLETSKLQALLWQLNATADVTADADEDDFMASLKQDYDKTIYDKLDRLEEFSISIQNSPDQGSVKALAREVHKIAGSAGSYGYAAVSVVCKKFENELNTIYENIDSADQKWIQSLFGSLKAIQEAFQLLEMPSEAIQKKPTEILLPKSDQHCHIYMIDPDASIHKELKHKGQQHGLTIITESHAKHAEASLQDLNFSCDLLLVSKKTDEPELNGYSLIRQFRHTHSRADTSIGILMEHGEIEERILAMREGVELFLEKPLSANSILKACEPLLQDTQKENYRVLILDDDPSICQYIDAILSPLSIEVKTMQESMKLFSVLDEFNPNLLVLDLGLPGCDGMDLIHMLRTDPRYNQMPIIVITGREGETVIEQAYNAGVDDFISKPLVRRIFQARILNFKHKHTLLTMVRDRDSMTGLYNRRAFTEMFDVAVARHSRDNKEMVLALLDVDKLKTINDTYGHAAGDEMLTRFANLLETSFRKNDIIGRWGGDEFIILFDDINLYQAQFLLGVLFDELSKEQMLSDHPEVKVTFSSGIAAFPEQGEILEDLLKSADVAMYQAKSLTENAIRTTTPVNNHAGRTYNEVFIVDDDKQLLAMLQYSFETRGFSVNTLSLGKEAIETLGKRNHNKLPALIILDRELPDIDGMEVIKALKSSLPTDIPILFLSSKYTEQDILQGLQEGAVDYISKPFSLQILMEKSLRLLSS